MDYETFEKKLLTKFVWDDEGFAFQGTGDKTWLAFVDADGHKYEISKQCVIAIEDTDTHFAATSILDANGNELILITEPGKYFDHVFWNDHEYGLFSIDCIQDFEDELDMDEYAEMSKDERIQQMPFFQNLLAESLEELFDGIEDFTKEEFWADPVKRQKKKKKTAAKKATKKKATKKKVAKRVVKKARKRATRRES